MQTNIKTCDIVMRRYSHLLIYNTTIYLLKIFLKVILLAMNFLKVEVYRVILLGTCSPITVTVLVELLVSVNVKYNRTILLYMISEYSSFKTVDNSDKQNLLLFIYF